jgi:outer membrane protein assembly factor BamB
VASDWPHFRGPTHNGISTDRIRTNWTGAATNPLWRVTMTNSLTSLAVSGGKVFTQSRRDVDGFDKDVCVALSATNGTELWATPVDDAYYPNGGVGYDDGPRTTPTVADGSVFVLTSYLKLYRLNAITGAIIWQKDLPALYGSVAPDWQNAASPLVDNGLVYLNGGANEGTSPLALMAFRVSDGALAWRAHDEGIPTYASPTLATIHGIRQVIFATLRGLISINPANGDLFWRADYPPFEHPKMLAVSPVVWEDIIFITGSLVYGLESVAYQASFSNNVWSITPLWSTSATAAHWMTPVCHNGFLYGPFGIFQFDSVNARLTCLDIRTGAVRWTAPSFGRGQTLLVGNELVCVTERGDLVLVKANPTAYTELGRFQAIPNFYPDTNKCWNMPAIADGKVYVRSTALVAAFDLSFPALKLDPPRATTPGQIQLTVGTANGAPITSNRAAAIEILAATNPVAPFGAWVKLTNSLALTNGRVRVDNIDSSAHPRRFFIGREPE